MFLVAYLGTGLVVGSRAAITAHDMCTQKSVWRALNAVQKPYLSKPTKETPSQVAGKAFVSGVVDPFGCEQWGWWQGLGVDTNASSWILARVPGAALLVGVAWA